MKTIIQKSIEEIRLERHTNNLKVQIGNRVSGYNKGYFVTVNSQLTEADGKINCDTLDHFGGTQVRQICDAINRFCTSKSNVKYKWNLRTVAAIEIGRKTGRLHSHMMLLHHGETDRTFQEVDGLVRDLSRNILKMFGDDACKVKPFNLRKDWIVYFVKGNHFMKSRYGYMNIECY